MASLRVPLYPIASDIHNVRSRSLAGHSWLEYSEAWEPTVILARLDHADEYAGLHPRFARAFEWLRRTDLEQLELGRHELGDGLAAIVSDAAGKGAQQARLEVHRRTIDVQFCQRGEDLMGWLPAQDLRLEATDYDAQADAQLFYDQPACWVPLPTGCLAIFFPSDGHAPLAAPAGAPLLKVVVKVPVD